MAAASSAESLPKYSRLIAHSHGKGGNLDRGLDGQIFVSTKKTKFINPFDPSKVHGELTAYHRRWVHAFPRDKHGLAFQAHHALEKEDDGEDGDRLSVSGSTLSPVRNISSGSFNVGSFSKMDGKGSSFSDGQEFRGLSQAGRRSRFISGSSLVETLVPMGSRPDSLDSHGMDQRMDSLGGLDKAQVPPSSTPAQPAKWDDYGIGPEDLKEASRAVPPKPAWSRRKRRPIPCERRLSNASLKGVEDFTSVQRTGVDWKSLTEPACLPITVDFFPSELRLNQDYYQSPLELVANCCQNEFDGNARSNNKYQYSWIADHQKVDTFEAFREMVSQRLSQGFQLIFDPKDTSGSKTSSLRWSGQNGSHHQNSIFALHQVLIEQKELLMKKSTNKRGKETWGRSTDVCVKLSLGKVFQELKLVYPHIHVTVYKQKVQYSPKPLVYGYNLCRAWPVLPGDQESSKGGEPPLLSMEARFSYKRTEEYNWNYLDQHVCGYSDFEVLQESHRYWRCRYLLLPTTPSPMQSPPGQQTEEERQFIASREAILIASFTRFLEFLNHVKRSLNPSASIYQQSNRHLKRHGSLPASHALLQNLGGGGGARSTTGSISSNTASSIDFSNLVVSPGLSSMSIQSPSGTKFVRRHSEAPPASETPVRSHSSFSKHATPTHHHSVDPSGSVPPEESVLRQFGKKAGDVPSSPAHSGPSSSAHRHSPNIGGGGGGGSPRLLRRKKSLDDLLVTSPTPDRSSASEGKKDGNLGVVQGDQPLSGRSSRESSDRGTDSVGIRTRDFSPTPPSVQITSPETVTDDASTSVSSFDASIQLLDSSSPTNLILRHMENADEGLDFLAPHVGLKSSSCFVAMEAVNWAMEKINGVKTRRDGVKLLQSMVQEQQILHASMDLSIPFLDGYLIYCVPSRMNQDALGNVKETSGNGDVEFYMVSPDYETFSKRWFEVVVQHPSAFLPFSSEQQQPCMEASPASTSPYVTGYSLYATSSHYQPFYRENIGQLAMRIPTIMVNRYVELNPDPQFKSDRPEWCYVHYDHTYNPRCGFQFEFQWMVTTVVLISQLIQNWAHKAAMCGFNLIPVPMLHTLSKDEGDSSPFTTRTYIPLLLPPSFPGTSMPLSEAVGKIMAAILQKLGFVLDPGSVSDDLQDLNLTLPITSRIYVHCSGSSLVGPTCADSVVRLMERDRRTRTSSLGTTLGRGDFADLNYMGEIMTEGRGDSGMAGTQMSLGESRKFVPGESSYDNNWNAYQTPKFSYLKQNENESSTQLQCGFYWYRNMALFRHKGVVSHSSTSGGDRGGAGGGISSDHRSLQEKMVALCSNKEDSLSQLCVDILGSNFDI